MQLSSWNVSGYSTEAAPASFSKKAETAGLNVSLSGETIITFAFYGADKVRAQRGARRISERALLLLSIIGGAFGGIFGMRKFHHKTKHWYFVAVNILGVIIHTALAIFLSTLI